MYFLKPLLDTERMINGTKRICNRSFIRSMYKPMYKSISCRKCRALLPKSSFCSMLSELISPCYTHLINNVFKIDD